MACFEHYCKACKGDIMDNVIYKFCPICKSPDITNDFDESPAGDDYDTTMEDDE